MISKYHKVINMTEQVNKRKEDIEWLADHYEWHLFDYRGNEFMQRFQKGGFVINVWLSKLTVSIVKNGKQFFYKKLSILEIEKILMNPHNYLKPQE